MRDDCCKKDSASSCDELANLRLSNSLDPNLSVYLTVHCFRMIALNVQENGHAFAINTLLHCKEINNHNQAMNI